MKYTDIDKLSKTVAVIGLQFNILQASYLCGFEIGEVLELLNSEVGNKRFRKIDDFMYKFNSQDDRQKFLNQLTKEEKDTLFHKNKESSMKTLLEMVNQLYIIENKKLHKDQILKSMIDISEYLILDEKIKQGESYIDFVIRSSYRNSVNFEKALIVKTKLELRRKNYEEIIRLCNQITIFPEYLVKKYEIMIEMAFQQGNADDITKYENKWKNALEIDTIYKNFNLFYKKIDFSIRKALYDESIRLLKEKEGELFPLLEGTPPPIYTKLVGDLYNLLGNGYYEKGDYKEALKYYLRSVELYKKNKFEREMLFPYNNIAEIYKAYKKYDKSLTIYKNIFHSSKGFGEKEITAVSVWNMGEVYFLLNDFGNAEKYFTDAEKLFFDSGFYTKYENYIKVFFAKLYFQNNRPEISEEYVDDVLLSAYEKGELKEYADALTIKGKLVSKKKEDPASYFEEAIDIYKKLELENELKEVEKLKLFYKKV